VTRRGEPNRLVREKSPYLLQHAHNPVDWHPWGEEALSLAQREDKPILLSIGYSACHWCHVMERESFEDAEVAALMNASFVNVKVDREERPDLDGIYMKAVQLLTGGGGWPLTAFLTPSGRAFYGGTYFPPVPRHGMPSFRQVLLTVADAYATRREEVERGAGQLLEAIRADGRPQPTQPGDIPAAVRASTAEPPDFRTLAHAFHFLRGRFDATHGGFGPAPKFPQPTTLEVLLRYHYRTGEEKALNMVLHTLRAMGRGGLRDHLSGGFHRYSVDSKWLVPHFEKMLYDNGLLARIYLHGYQLTGDAELKDVVTSTLDYLLEDLTDAQGGFYSARDADSEGEEGLFYLWTPSEVKGVLGAEAGALFQRVYDVTDRGNFEGRNILNLPRSLTEAAAAEGMNTEELEGFLRSARASLKEVRSQRESPFRDEKVLVGWNSFVLRALAEAGAVLGRKDYLLAATRNAEFMLTSLKHEGRLLRVWKDGPGTIPGFLEDYAGFGNALLTLHETTLDTRWLDEARWLIDLMMALFWDEGVGLVYDTPRDGEELVVRPRDVMDNATPAGNSLAVELLLRGGHAFGEDGFREAAERILAAERETMNRFPSAFGRLLSSLDSYLEPPVEVALIGPAGSPETTELWAESRRPFLPSPSSRVGRWWRGSRPPSSAATSLAPPPSPIRRSWVERSEGSERPGPPLWLLGSEPRLPPGPVAQDMRLATLVQTSPKYFPS
jgi:uncharacterized protein YyaL (SSP411 family)